MFPPFLTAPFHPWTIMPHNMTPPLALTDPSDAASSGIDLSTRSARPAPVIPLRRPVARKHPPVEDLALMLVVIGFLFWSVAFAYRLSL